MYRKTKSQKTSYSTDYIFMYKFLKFFPFSESHGSTDRQTGRGKS